MSDTPKIASLKPIVTELEAGTYFWCACGHAMEQPYCDGSHHSTKFSPLEFTMSEKKKVALCTCKYTKTPPFCDGEHKKLKTEG